jgi:hypothetical protein
MMCLAYLLEDRVQHFLELVRGQLAQPLLERLAQAELRVHITAQKRGG